MKNIKYFAMALVGLLGMASMANSAVAGGLPDISISGDIGVVNQYVWRGLPQSIDPNGQSHPAVQGDLALGMGGLTVSGWFSNSYPSPAPQTMNKTVTEFDWTLDYSGSISDVGYSIGTIYYTYLYDSGSNFDELYAGLSYNAFITPSVTVYVNPKDSNNNFYLAGDTWIDLGLSSNVKGFDVSAKVSYAAWKKDTVNRPEASPGALKNGFNLVTLSLSKDFKVSDLTITPSITGTIPIIAKAADGNRYIYNTVASNEVVFGVNVAY